MTTEATEPTGAGELANPGYEVFILALSVLSLVNLVLVLPFSPLDSSQQQALFFIDCGLTLVFLADFAQRLWHADSRKEYLVQGRGWLDFVGSLPGLRVFRVFRVLRVGRLIREYGLGTLARWMVRQRAQSAMYVVCFLVVVILEVASVLILPLEAASAEANITSAGDALWWGIVTMTTVGYGDQYPVTTGGRIVGVFVLVAGVGLFGTFTGYLANAFLKPSEGERPAEQPVSDAQALVAEIRAELAAQEQRSAELRARLAQLDALV
jgi:voltage-gated potassium channel